MNDLTRLIEIGYACCNDESRAADRQARAVLLMAAGLGSASFGLAGGSSQLALVAPVFVLAAWLVLQGVRSWLSARCEAKLERYTRLKISEVLQAHEQSAQSADPMGAAVAALFARRFA